MIENKRISSNLIMGRIHRHSSTRPTEVVSDFSLDYGLTISYDYASMGVEKENCMFFGDHSLSY